MICAQPYMQLVLDKEIIENMGTALRIYFIDLPSFLQIWFGIMNYICCLHSDWKNSGKWNNPLDFFNQQADMVVPVN